MDYGELGGVSTKYVYPICYSGCKRSVGVDACVEVQRRLAGIKQVCCVFLNFARIILVNVLLRWATCDSLGHRVFPYTSREIFGRMRCKSQKAIVLLSHTYAVGFALWCEVTIHAVSFGFLSTDSI